MADITVARIIADQIGRRAFTMMGARDLLGDQDSLRFRVGRNAKGVTHVLVKLDPSDTYTVQFVRVGPRPGFKVSTLAEESLVYAEDLHRTIERNTGLYLSL